MRSVDLAVSLLAFGSVWIGTGVATAQNNLLVIQQTGSNNTLSVDQSNASNSAIGGLELVVPDTTSGILAIDADDIARQAGDGNVASVIVNGGGANVGLQQNNANGGAGNVANIRANGLSQSAIGQFGAGNRGTVTVTGDLGGRGTLLQNGDGNTGSVDVAGEGSGTLIQNGSNNTRSLNVEGSANVSVVQNGSGLSDASSNAAIASAVASGATGLPTGVQVISNATSVQITQTALPGIGSGR
ncbi:hypothetical protein [Aureimonas psammosilenae]|uniref:hypothetical protein n=1 Tax=Aureimonas psammosilenae TaxID=2495496 RepID=UPI00126090CE|nr:hypothetical protein [Aureimonas psammosilenae]